MNKTSLLKVIKVSVLVATGLLLAGIFILQGIVTPVESARYGLALEMFTSQDWVYFHLRAWLWLFISAFISGYFVSKQYA